MIHFYSAGLLVLLGIPSNEKMLKFKIKAMSPMRWQSNPNGVPHTQVTFKSPKL